MTDAELLRTAVTGVVAVTAAYSAVRMLLYFTAARRGSVARRTRDRYVSDIMHALTGCTLGFLLLPREHTIPLVVCAASVVVFAVIAARFVVTLRHEGLTSRAGVDQQGGHSGYNLHHLAGCAAMMYLCATAPIADAPGGPGAFSAETASLSQQELTSLTGVNWLFGMYFLVAATSLGFRVAEPAVRITYRIAAPATAGATLTQATAARPAAERLTSRAAPCASEVVLSATLAFAFLA